MFRLIPSRSATPVFDRPSRWNKRWTSAQSCTSYTLSSPELLKRFQGDQQHANHRGLFDGLEVLSIHPTLTTTNPICKT